MRDIPNFSTVFGSAGLVLNQIPYSGRAYIHIRNVQDLELLLAECSDFCVAAGAENVYVSGDCDLSLYNPPVRIFKMQRPIEGIGDTDACLMPITDDTLDKWLQLHNNAMIGIDHAAYLDRLEGRKLLQVGSGYFVHMDGEILGVGIARGSEISALAAVKKGAGRDVVIALSHALSNETVHLEVAETNTRAISLYHRLGFLQTGIKTVWYKIR